MFCFAHVPEVNIEDLLALPKVGDDRVELHAWVLQALRGGAAAEVEAVVGRVHQL